VPEPRAVRELIARVRRTIDERELVKSGDRVLLAVSGGPDSLAMLHVLARLTRPLSLELHVAHFDHRLRDGSNRDAAFVVRHAARLDLPVTVGAAETTERVPGRSPEEDARIKRKRFLDETAAGLDATRIAVAHTRDDQAETVLMRFLQGTGTRGLAGIDPRRWYYIRPLIDASRAQVEAFCRALRLRPRLDPTNEDPAFLRNALRHETIPYLRATINDRLPEALARMTDVMRDEDAYLDQRAAEGAPISWEGEDARLGLDELRALPPALQRRALRLLSWSHNGHYPNAERTEAARILALDGRTGDRVELSGGLSVWLGYGFLLIGRSRPSSPEPSPVALDVPGPTELSQWGLGVRSWITTEPPGTWPDGRTVCVLDADRTESPLRMRRARSGDRFRPLGMARSKKVSDFFTDERIPRDRRSRIPLLVDAGDRIAWIVGHRISDTCKVTTRTKRCLWIETEEA